MSQQIPLLHWVAAGRITLDPERRARIAMLNADEEERGRKRIKAQGEGWNEFNPETGRWEWKKAAIG